ncbi:MAG: hypothetical protein OXC91_01515 [Rhodobacteraceae bacterium]|nr:hypothetical protein [Paracoccaceae bacterium]
MTFAADSAGLAPITGSATAAPRMRPPATVVQAFRRTGLPLQRIRKALSILADQGELEYALASRQLFSDGASILSVFGIAPDRN